MTDSWMRQAIARTTNGLKMLLGRGRVLLTNETDKTGIQFVQVRVSAKEVMDLPRMTDFGFNSRIPKDGDVAIMFLNAERTWGIVVASNHQQYRFQLDNDGEVAISDAFGKSIWFKKASMVIDAGGQPITVNNAKGMTINVTDDVVFNMGGKNFIINNPGLVELAGAGGKKIALDQDPVVAGEVQASSTKVTGK